MASDGMRSGVGVGLVLPPALDRDVLWGLVDDVEAGGFNSIWVTDRTVAATPWLDSLTLLAALAARTARCVVGTSVLVVARRNPVYVAHALATVAHLAPGRLVAGLGLGGLEPAEFELAGVLPSDRAALTDQYINVMRALWTSDSVEYVGPQCAATGIALSPRPQSPIPVWVGGNSPGALARTGRLGDGWLSIFCSPDRFRNSWATVCQQAADAGRDSSSLTPATYLFSAIGNREGEAESVLEPAMRALFGAGLDVVGDACLYGTPSRWVQTIAEFADAGVQQVNILLFSEDCRRDTELIADRVLPELELLPSSFLSAGETTTAGSKLAQVNS